MYGREKRLFSLLYRLAVICGSKEPLEDAVCGFYSWKGEVEECIQEDLDGASDERYIRVAHEILKLI